MSQVKAIVDKLLTNVSSAYIPEGFISEAILPTISVKQDTGKLGGYGNQHLRIVNTVMGGKGKAPRYESIVRNDSTYSVENHGLEGLVTKADYRNVEEPFDAEKDETLGLSTVLWLGKEKALADALGNASVLTQNTTLSGTAQFNDYANSDPLAKFKDARLAVKQGCGLPPDTAIMSWEVANTLAYHPGILEALGFTKNRAGQLSDQELAKALGVKRLLIGSVSYNSAHEGQNDVLAPVWGKNIIFAVCPLSPQKYQVSLGYDIRLAGEKPRQVTKAEVTNPPGSKQIIVTDSYDQFISNVNAGYLIKNAIA